MIKGIGMDIVEIGRIRSLMERQPKLAARILTPSEQRQFEEKQGARRWEYAAGRFAAKEAYAKANGTGIGAGLSFQDIETGADKSGKPMILRPRRDGVHLTITHTKEYAAATVVIEE